MVVLTLSIMHWQLLVEKSRLIIGESDNRDAKCYYKQCVST